MQGLRQARADRAAVGRMHLLAALHGGAFAPKTRPEPKEEQPSLFDLFKDGDA
jgi:hypothetical protein